MLNHPARAFWIVATATLLLDQLTKSVVRILWRSQSALLPFDAAVAKFVSPAYDPYESVPVFGEWFMFTHVRNTGAAFGLLPGYRPIFIATSVIVLVVVAAYWRRARPANWLVVIPLGLIAGGAVGNLIDRAVVGRVTDFLHFAVIDFPVFNVADSAIFIGVGILIAWLLFGPQPEDEQRTEPDAIEPADSSALNSGEQGQQ